LSRRIRAAATFIAGLISLHQDLEEEEGGGLKHLQKRWFDNMKDYLERKEARIAATTQQRRQLTDAEPPEKRNKMEDA
jgi:hypothetical protein